MKTVVIVAPHFIPAFLPSVHRARLWCYHLEEFGWHPIILTTDPKYYECQLSDAMLDLLPKGLEVIRTRAVPVKPIRVIGDIGFRSLFWYYRAIKLLAARRRIDFVHITIPSCPAALLGPSIRKRLGIPYGIDYIDPWIAETPHVGPILHKAWIAARISKVLEPVAVRKARLITGINEAYFASVIRRNPHLREQAETAGMPYGNSDLDYDALLQKPRPLTLFPADDGKLHFVYAGALLPKGFVVLDNLLLAFDMLRRSAPDIAARVRFHFVGTGTIVNDSRRGHTVRPYIEKHGLQEFASELPSRIDYLDVLNHLRSSAAVLVLGSTEPHYSPSKLYQAVMSHRPVFAMLHEKSTAAQTMRSLNAGALVTFSDTKLPAPSELAATLGGFITGLRPEPTDVNVDAFREVTARETTRILALALDRAIARERRECGLQFPVPSL